MTSRFAVLCCCLVAGLAHAAELDDAIDSVKAAQKADEGNTCKGLSTKLKLALEALGDAKKSLKLIGPAKGRVETAKDAAASGCPDAVKSKVGEALAAALASVEKAAAPKKVEHTGAAFEAACTANDQCASEHCFVDANGKGYCSKECSAPGECPAKWQCRRPGSEAFKICIK